MARLLRGRQRHQRLFARRSFRADVFRRWCVLKQTGIVGDIGTTIDGITDAIAPGPVARNREKR